MKKLFYPIFIAAVLFASAPAVNAQTTTATTCVDNSSSGTVVQKNTDGSCPAGSSSTVMGAGGTLVNVNMKYIPLEPLPNVPQDGSATFCTLLNGLFRLLIFLGGLIAVGSFVYSGIMYMTSEVVGMKSNAKRGLQASLWGLAILLASYIILNTINPQLLSCSNVLNPVNGYQTIASQTQQAVTCDSCTIVSSATQAPTLTTINNNAAITNAQNNPSDPAALTAASAELKQLDAGCTAKYGGDIGPTDSTTRGTGCLINTDQYFVGSKTYNGCANIPVPTGGFQTCYYNK